MTGRLHSYNDIPPPNPQIINTLGNIGDSQEHILQTLLRSPADLPREAMG